jgi:acetoin utilization protein AcuB
MLVGERMSHPVITINPEMPIVDALNLMKHEHIRRAPVVKDGRMLGIVADKDILNASPSPATSLSVWELNYLISKITVAEVMTRKVLTVSEDTPLEVAARFMADNKIGALPVMRNNSVVGIITETDLFKIFLELMGVRYSGVRATVLVREERGELARLTQAIANAGGNFVAFGMFQGEDPSNRMITFKVDGMTKDQVKSVVEPIVAGLVDIRDTIP